MPVSGSQIELAQLESEATPWLTLVATPESSLPLLLHLTPNPNPNLTISNSFCYVCRIFITLQPMLQQQLWHRRTRLHRMCWPIQPRNLRQHPPHRSSVEGRHRPVYGISRVHKRTDARRLDTRQRTLAKNKHMHSSSPLSCPSCRNYCKTFPANLGFLPRTNAIQNGFQKPDT